MKVELPPLSPVAESSALLEPQVEIISAEEKQKEEEARYLRITVFL